MDGTGNKRGEEGGGGYIWLRYATQFAVGGRTHTIEMGIPMPLGADEETRAQLLDEAEAGMDQLADHIEQRVSQALHRAQPSQASVPAHTPKAPPAPKPVTRPAAMPTIPAAMPAPQTSVQPLQSVAPRETEGERDVSPNGEVYVPPTRPNIGASMPSTPGVGSDTSGNISIPDFLRAVKENYGLDSTQAMKLLKVKTLSGINLRAALIRLQSLVGHENSGEEKPEVAESRSTGAKADTPPTIPPGTPSNTSFNRVPSSNATSARDTGNRAKREQNSQDQESVGEERSIHIFDEEVGPDDLDEELEDLDLPRELTMQESDQARAKIDRLRESRGATTASEKRLQVLNNLVLSQINQEQLQELIEGVWTVTVIKKLKVDQLEDLISWAKEDEFVSEVEAVLLLLEEERYARGNR